MGRRKSLTTQLTILFALVSTTVLLLLGLIIGRLVGQHFEELDDELLRESVASLQRPLAKVSSATELEAIQPVLHDAHARPPGLTVVVFASDGRKLYERGDADVADELVGKRNQAIGSPVTWVAYNRHRYRGLIDNAPMRIDASSPTLVGAATDLVQHQHFMLSFQVALWSVVGFAALLTGFLGWLAARGGLAPLRAIGQRVSKITATRLDQRLANDAIPTELVEVVSTLNEMLARLQESFRKLTEFSSDLAHELRTPVANLLTQTQVGLSKPRTPEEYREVLASNGEELERLARLISDMLFLAKSDNALAIPNREPTDLRRQVEEVFEFYDALAEEKGVRLTIAGSGFASGDKLMLRRAISNLVSNAIRHSLPGSEVAVSLTKSASGLVELSVQNQGETIGDEHLGRIFDRFYRVSSSRHLFAEGAGLGLAITRSIARAHGGDITARSTDGVTTFVFRIPSEQC